ncbi:MAG TPA: hypothetical protein DCF87_09360 [Opitutae bacterium]|nr:hypothetical protein [Opitutae bacterium]|tara:strand:+ start:2741 stop:3193 length:453 start_codon:yes stop_codon:yes gene_type:complete
MFASFLTPEFLSLIGGSITGFIFKTMAEKRLDDKARFERTLSLIDKRTEVADAAVNRVGIEAGKVVRRIIVLCILFGTIIAPFILPFFSIPTVVELEETRYAPLDFFGLFGTNNYISFQTINGYLFTTENRQILVTIVGFYFGNASAKSR